MHPVSHIFTYNTCKKRHCMWEDHEVKQTTINPIICLTGQESVTVSISNSYQNKKLHALENPIWGKKVGANPIMIMPNLVIYYYIKEFSLIVLGTKNINLSFKRKRPIFPNLKIWLWENPNQCLIPGCVLFPNIYDVRRLR